jgi:hypothetical protein
MKCQGSFLHISFSVFNNNFVTFSALQLKPLDLYSYYEYETVEELPVVPPPTTLTFAEDREIKVSYGSSRPSSRRTSSSRPSSHHPNLLTEQGDLGQLFLWSSLLRPPLP